MGQLREEGFGDSVSGGVPGLTLLSIVVFNGLRESDVLDKVHLVLSFVGVGSWDLSPLPPFNMFPQGIRGLGKNLNNPDPLESRWFSDVTSFQLNGRGQMGSPKESLQPSFHWYRSIR